MIEKLIIKNIASYTGEGVELEGLKKINFIYGANGTGKTTISNYLADQSNDDYSNCHIAWQYNQPYQCLVYNKKFREENFKGSIKGVFTLGKSVKEDIEMIQAKQKELEDLESKAKQQKKTLDDKKGSGGELDSLTAAFSDEIWQLAYRKYEQDFKPAFRGHIKNKKVFSLEVVRKYDQFIRELREIKLDELQARAKTVFNDVSPQHINELITINFDEGIAIIENGIWQKSVIGKSDVDIAKLIQQLNMNDWVDKGREYLLESSNTCPFCQQDTVDDQFKKKLENYFDTEYKQNIDTIMQLYERFEQYCNNLLSKLNSIAQQETEYSDYFDKDIFSSYQLGLEAELRSIGSAMVNKRTEPSRSISLETPSLIIHNMNQLIIQTNEKIKQHNDIVQNYEREKESLILDVWMYIISVNQSLIRSYIGRKSGLNKAIESIEEQLNNKRKAYSELKAEIKNLEKNITSVQPTVDEINRLLRNMGFENFQLVSAREQKNHYQIQRENGELATETLSEGEMTFITFLYFLQLAKGSVEEVNISEKRVVIIDDPISSLDSSVLFAVSTLLKDFILDLREQKQKYPVEQLIILTHNIYFHKEVTYNGSGNRKCKHTHFWILRKLNKETSLISYAQENPIQTSYQLLWDELKDRDKLSNITLQNTMRRIIEYYFKVLGGFKDEEITEHFDNCQDQQTCQSLLSWVNDGSHTIYDDMHISGLENTVDKYFNIFKQIFINEGHEKHFNMMMGINEVIQLENMKKEAITS
ncbi:MULTISPECIES: AAA family ATPase [Cysteiniphilum]|uniref:AAA family ATPase n=1 Tax=Cysteiniphilum TaxID=2056696 RepID=UPI0017820994|nr:MULTISPECIES: AAA family ATPase [Cysteiniphilum]